MLGDNSKRAAATNPGDISDDKPKDPIPSLTDFVDASSDQIEPVTGTTASNPPLAPTGFVPDAHSTHHASLTTNPPVVTAVVVSNATAPSTGGLNPPDWMNLLSSIQSA